MKKKKFILGLALPLTALTLGAVGAICVANETVLTGVKAEQLFHVNVTADNLIEKEGKFIAITNEEKSPLEFEITAKPADFKQNGKLGTFKAGTIIRNVTPIRGINKIKFATNLPQNNEIFSMSYGYDDKDGNKVIFGHDVKINNDYEFSNNLPFVSNGSSVSKHGRPKNIRATYVEFKVLKDVVITSMQLEYECTDGNYIAPTIDSTKQNIYFNAVDSWKKGFIDLSNAFNQYATSHRGEIDNTNDDDGNFDAANKIANGKLVNKNNAPLNKEPGWNAQEKSLAAMSAKGNYLELKFMSDKAGTFDFGLTWQSASGSGANVENASKVMKASYGNNNDVSKQTAINIAKDLTIQPGGKGWTGLMWYDETLAAGLTLHKGYNVIRIDVLGNGTNRFPNIWRFNMLNINYTE